MVNGSYPSAAREKLWGVAWMVVLAVGTLAVDGFRLGTAFVGGFVFPTLVLFLPYLFWLSLVRLTESGIEYVRFSRHRLVPWSQVADVHPIPWFPLKVCMIRLRGMIWPFSWILADDSVRDGIRMSPFNLSSGDFAKKIKEHLISYKQ